MLIGIAVPAYNQERFIRRCVDSVLAQSFGNFALILIDEGSTDDSLLRLRGCEDPHVPVACSPNIGAGVARYDGVDLARGIPSACIAGQTEQNYQEDGRELRGC